MWLLLVVWQPVPCPAMTAVVVWLLLVVWQPVPCPAVTAASLCVGQSAVSLEPRRYTVTAALRPCNRAKNSCPALLPTEAGRLSLPPRLSVEGSDYINASWMPGNPDTRPK